MEDFARLVTSEKGEVVLSHFDQRGAAPLAVFGLASVLSHSLRPFYSCLLCLLVQPRASAAAVGSAGGAFRLVRASALPGVGGVETLRASWPRKTERRGGRGALAAASGASGASAPPGAADPALAKIFIKVQNSLSWKSPWGGGERSGGRFTARKCGLRNFFRKVLKSVVLATEVVETKR